MIASISSPVTAQDTLRAAPVIVTATRTPLTQGTLPVAVTVLTGDELRSRGITTVGEALTRVTSAHVAKTGSHGATTSLFLRGGESKYVKVLVDGVAANDPGGVYDFASLTTDNVERIEIVRGPASVVHGADAVTGVVHVITRRGSGAQRTDLELRSGVAPRDRIAAGRDPGSVATLDASASVSGAAAGGDYSLSLGRQQSTGLYDVNNRYQNNTLSGRFGFRASDATDVRVSLRYNDYRFAYPTNGGGTPVDTNAFRLEDRIVIGAEVERRLARAVRAVLALASSVNEGGTTDEMDSPTGSSFVSQDRTRRRSAELRLHAMPVSSTSLAVGAKLEQQDQRSQFQSESPFGPFNDRFGAARRSLGGYAEATLTPMTSLTLTAGARVDDNQQFGTFGTGRVGASFRPRAATRIRLTAGNAFREPSFFENFSTGFVAGNPGLRPERTLSLDGGVDHDVAGGRASLSITGFAQRFRDMIDYTGSTSACGYSYCNVAEATSNGVELEVAGRIAGAVHASAGATFLRTEVVEPGFDASSAGLYRKGEALIRRPERNAHGEIEYRTRPFTVSARLLAVGVRTDRDFTGFPATPVTLPSYERVDLSAEYAIHDTGRRRTVLTARVENATNAGYQNVYNFLAPRRTVSLGVRASFQ
ncbi:MAG TPA: TonB-dependent receptor [Gemmatimonadaceae bacterium]|nr:TonB-dependent receptor [Gemmatimonadaceae bacterium]